MTSLSNRGKKANGKDKSIHRSVALMSHKTTQFVTLIWNIPRSVILLTNNFSKETFGKLYIVWIDNTFHFWIAFSLTLLMRFYLCFITVVLKLVLLLMSSSSLPLIVPHPKKSNLFLYLPIFYRASFFIILSGTVSIYINTNFGPDDETGDTASPEDEVEGSHTGRRNKPLDRSLYGNYVGKIGKFWIKVCNKTVRQNCLGFFTYFILALI